MRIFYAFLRAAFANASIYHLDFWVGLVSVVILMYTSSSLWTILYRQDAFAFGMDLKRMTTYGVVGMLLVPAVNSAVNTQTYIAQQVRTGTLETELLKPVSFILLMLSRNLGEFVVQLLTRGVPAFVIGYIFLDVQLPAEPIAGFAFLVSLLLGYLIFFAINFLMGMLAIITVDIRGYTWAFQSLVRLASGYMVPLWMFPSVLATLLGALPFREVYFVPLSIYVGAQQGSLTRVLLIQITWAVGLLLSAQGAWLGAKRRLTGQGG